MSRIRTVKPDLFRHEALFDAELESGLPLRLAFIGLFTVADCEGRFIWKPRTLKLDVLPHDTVDFSAVLSALERAGFIERYEVDGVHYGLIPSFKKHQQIPSREQERGSSLPGKPVLDPVHVETRTEHEPVHVEARTEHCPELQEGEEEEEEERKGRGKEEERARTRKTPPAPIAPDWQPGPSALDILATLGVPEAFAMECLPEFRLYWSERGDKRPGWNAAFVNSVKHSWGHRTTQQAPPGKRLSKQEQIAQQSAAAIAEWLASDPAAVPVNVIEGEALHVAH